jgi:hypothetical protein
MSESPEHRFISETFLSALETFSASRLYTYSEADRKALDFACSLERDWRRVLAGQTLWKHSEGIAKDLLHLLSENQAAIVAYVARHNSANERTLFDLIEHVRRSRFATELRRLRIFWIADDFDADNEFKRAALRQHLQESIAKRYPFKYCVREAFRSRCEIFSGERQHAGPPLSYAIHNSQTGFS